MIWFVGLVILLVIILDRADKVKIVEQSTVSAVTSFIQSLQPPTATAAAK